MDGFLGMSLRTLGAIFSGYMSAGKGVIGEDEGTIRVGQDVALSFN